MQNNSIAIIQEVCGGGGGRGILSDSDARTFIEDICPNGRGWFTGHVAIVAGPTLNGINFDVSCSDDGRLLRADYTIDGIKRTVGCLYAPAQPTERREFMSSLQDWLPAGSERRSLVGGDFNCVQMPALDIVNGSSTCRNWGHAEWAQSADLLGHVELLHTWRSGAAGADRTRAVTELTWASSPYATGIVYKRLDWFTADVDGIADVSNLRTSYV